MHTITARNVGQALPEALRFLFDCGQSRDSRNGPVLQSPVPVTTCYLRPLERVLFWPQRDANPFFHFFESLWMLAGRRDAAYLSQFNSRMLSFSDDGETFNGAYGDRWRHHFGPDQLEELVRNLLQRPLCRRQVLGMWDPRLDLTFGRDSRDVPCNTHAYFQVNHEQKLDMMVCCRSNDIVWGCYGANAVHFSFLQEYVAIRLGLAVGRYWQVSFNWHGYLDTLQKVRPIAQRADDCLPGAPGPGWDPYACGAVSPYPLMRDTDLWLEECRLFLDEGTNAVGYREPFFRRVALPLLKAWRTFKSDKSFSAAVEARHEASCCAAEDWRTAASQWLLRREVDRLRKEEAKATAEEDAA